MGVSQSSEDRFSHVADREKAASEFYGFIVFEVSLECTGCIGGFKGGAIGVESHFFELREFFTADGDEFFGSGLGL